MNKLKENYRKLTKKDKTKLAFALVLLIGLIIAIVAYLLWPRNNVNPLGYGSGTVQETDNGKPLQPAAYSNSSPDGKNNFEIKYHQSDAHQNKLVVNGKEIASAVLYAVWSADSRKIIFNKTEAEEHEEENLPEEVSDSHNFDVANLWTADADGKNVKLIYDYKPISGIDYVSNGKQIAFTLTDRVGLIDINGGTPKFLEKYETDAITNTGAIYVPDIIYVSNSKFSVKYRDAKFWTNGKILSADYEFTK